MSAKPNKGYLQNIHNQKQTLKKKKLGIFAFFSLNKTIRYKNRE